tara:strand:- start:5148 stop:5564 length:417 start_codon:yes stop_codon:yes gene_type:complete
MIHLNHIGIAVEDCTGMKKLFSLLGLAVGSVETVPEQGVKTHFIELPKEKTNLELLEVISDSSPVEQFLKKRGPGVHHLSFQTDPGGLDALSEKLRSEGYPLIYDQPRLGAHNMRVNFIHPKATGGVLIEIMEPHHEK